MTENFGITVYGCEPDEAEMFRRLSPALCITPTMVSDAVSETNARLAAGNQCVSVGHKSEVCESVILALRDAGVKYISTRSIGCNHIDIKAAGRMGISVGTVAYSPDSVADYTLMLMLMAARNAKSTIHSVEKQDFSLNSIRGKELRDMTVGVLGTGRIGKAVMERLQGFGCHVLAYDSNQRTEGNYVSLYELLSSSDIVTLHVPLGEDTRHIIGRDQIRKMKRGAVLINTGRGALIDTGALVEALKSGMLGGAALDVLEGEEEIFYSDCSLKPINHPFLQQLQRMPNVIITPHTAYYTQGMLRETVDNTMKNCLSFERSLKDE